MRKPLVYLVFFCSLAWIQLRAATTSQWKIEQTNLAPSSGGTGLFTALVSHTGDPNAIKLSATVPFSNLKEFFVSNDKLAVIGAGKNTDAVVVFDLVRREEIDWFYCYQPQRAWDNWIVYVEWYPNHTTERTTDVLLLYDLTKSPTDNRLEENTPQKLPPSHSARPTRVGFPIYPESSLNPRSYRNIVDTQEGVRLVLGGPRFLTMPTNKLVFVASEEPGGDASSIQNHLVLIDLSKGIDAASVSRVSIPQESVLKSRTPGFIRVTAMQVASPNTVRLSVPKEQYGIEDILVEIPK